MSTVSRSPSPSSPDSAATKLERNPSVSCLHHLFSAFVDDLQTKVSGSGIFANAQNMIINGGTFVSHSRRLHKSCINMLLSLDKWQYWQKPREIIFSSSFVTSAHSVVDRNGFKLKVSNRIPFSNISLKQFKSFVTQCGPWGLRRSFTDRSVCHGGMHTIPRPLNFDARAQGTWF